MNCLFSFFFYLSVGKKTIRSVQIKSPSARLSLVDFSVRQVDGIHYLLDRQANFKGTMKILWLSVLMVRTSPRGKLENSISLHSGI